MDELIYQNSYLIYEWYIICCYFTIFPCTAQYDKLILSHIGQTMSSAHIKT